MDQSLGCSSGDNQSLSYSSGKWSVPSGGFKGGLWGLHPLPSNMSSIYINIRFSRLLNDMTLNQMISICVMKVKQNTN